MRLLRLSRFFDLFFFTLSHGAVHGSFSFSSPPFFVDPSPGTSAPDLFRSLMVDEFAASVSFFVVLNSLSYPGSPPRFFLFFSLPYAMD